jgi:catechol 2,3-dioxygenase-like lactoylglutathione lyase family enzyme
MKRPLILLLSIFIAVTTACAGQNPQRTTSMIPSLKGVQYVMLGVADIKASVAFYEGKLGLKVRQVSEDLAFLDAGTISLVLSSEVGRAAGDTEIVFGTEHVETTSGLLKKTGIVLLHEPHLVSGSSWAASFRDPDGHILSIFGPE